MARSKKLATDGALTATHGHNSKVPLTEDEAAALTVHYELKIIEGQRRLDVLMADLKSARDVVNGHFKRVTADLGFTRKEFEAEVIVLGRMTEQQYLNAEKRRARLHRLAGRSPGEQLDLIEVINDTVDEAMSAEHDGYRAGRRADDPVPPSEVSPILHPDWMRGWHAGQAFNGIQLVKAAEILARPKAGEMTAGEDPDEAEGDDGAEIEDGVRALKGSGWAAPTSEEQTFEEADGGKTIRQPRKTQERAAA